MHPLVRWLFLAATGGMCGENIFALSSIQTAARVCDGVEVAIIHMTI
jgi:hypothetical protein